MKWTDKGIGFFVGALFIFSGLVKLNDPIGTQIKLEEYFEVFSTDFTHFFEWLIPAALPIAMFLIILEIVLGIAVILKYKMKFTIWALSILIVFFTFLTFYSAYFNKVTDCGCFGDAIPLTPWESFTKDIILVVLIGYLFMRRQKLLDWFHEKTATYILASVTLVSIFVGIRAIWHLPFIDFRPYAIGDNIPQNMVPDEQPKFEYTFEKNGSNIISEQYLSEKDGYKYVSHRVTNSDKTIPKITDYNIWNESDGDFTQQSFEGSKLFLISYNTEIADTGSMKQIANLIDGLAGNVDAIALTSSSGNDFIAFENSFGITIPYYYGDATVLKAMIRSNPGIMLLNNGTVLGKWHSNDVPGVSEINQLLQ